MRAPLVLLFFFFFLNDTATTEIYTLSLHDALPILGRIDGVDLRPETAFDQIPENCATNGTGDRKSTRLNSSHRTSSHAVVCLKKKKHSLCCFGRKLQPVVHAFVPPNRKRAL